MQFGLLTISAIFTKLRQYKDVLLYRYVMNNFNSYASVSEMIATLGWPTLEQRHKTLRTIMMYKIVGVEAPTDGILIPSELRLRGHAKKFLQPQCQ